MFIHQEITIKCSVQKIFLTLTNSVQFSKFTGAPSEIESNPGGKFSCFGGMIKGFILELDPNSRLVQAWRAGNWDTSIYSIVKFEFLQIDENETKIIFDHTGFPKEHKKHLEKGWYENYWDPLKTYLEV
jgi:activator of HSP90 ATPase